MSVPFNPPKPGAGMFPQMEQPDDIHFSTLIPGTGGPYLKVGDGRYVSATDLVALVGSAGWVHPQEGEQLREKVVTLEQRVHELEAEVSNAAVDADKLAAADEILANARRNAELAAAFA